MHVLFVTKSSNLNKNSYTGDGFQKIALQMIFFGDFDDLILWNERFKENAGNF